MVRFITPIILLGIAATSFFVFTDPLYQNISDLRAQASAYNEALSNSKALENERDKLTSKYNAIDPVDLEKIKKLLPDNIDNIRLILEIGQVASPYGMILKNVKYNTIKEGEGGTEVPAVVQGGIAVTQEPRDYGIWDLEFSMDGTYNDFLNFLRDLESNLRIVDIASITFSSDARETSDSSVSDIYTFNFKIKTYWLKN